MVQERGFLLLYTTWLLDLILTAFWFLLCIRLQNYKVWLRGRCFLDEVLDAVLKLCELIVVVYLFLWCWFFLSRLDSFLKARLWPKLLILIRLFLYRVLPSRVKVFLRIEVADIVLVQILSCKGTFWRLLQNTITSHIIAHKRGCIIAIDLLFVESVRKFEVRFIGILSMAILVFFNYDLKLIVAICTNDFFLFWIFVFHSKLILC